MEQGNWIGRSLKGRYEIETLLGRGGMSTVYKAKDANLKRPVAVKLIHPHLSTDDDFIRRFQTEAAAVAAFRHTNIVQVFDFDNDGENYYMVFEFIPGETLQDHLDHLTGTDLKMPEDQSAGIMIEICNALGYAHGQGIIHRDIKPANIMLTPRGRAVLMDFGLVKMLNATSHTATGAIMGTARYMPPEIIHNEMPDARSDIYSLGVTFYQMLSGEPPFKATSVNSLILMHLHEPVPDLGESNPDIEPELVQIVNRSLEKDREQRYQSAMEMADDLKRFLNPLKPVSISSVFSSSQKDRALGFLKLTLPGGSIHEFKVSKSEITIGRGQTNDIIVQDEKMSRSHARFEFGTKGEVRVIDTGSTNGIMVNRARTASAAIKPGDVVQIGRSQVQFKRAAATNGEMTAVESAIDFNQTITELVPPKTLDKPDENRIVIHTPEKTWEVMLDETVKELSIGRGKTNDVVINHPSVSRTHAHIVRDQGSFKIKDRGSVNGLYVKGQRLDEVVLKPGTTVELGYANIVFMSGASKKGRKTDASV